MSKTTETGKQITLDVVESWLLVGFKELTKQMCTKKKTLKKNPKLIHSQTGGKQYLAIESHP